MQPYLCKSVAAGVFHCQRHRIALACGLALALMAGSVPVFAERIVFPQKNVSDIRGLLNVFHAFRVACLEQPVTRDLPERLLPEGYKLISRQEHFWGTQNEVDEPAWTGVMSKTGSEEGDWAGGDVIVDLSLPTSDRPEGGCNVTWHRAWDYEEGRERIALGMYGAFDSHVSYYLSSILRTKPMEALLVDPPHSGVSDWITFCWDGNMCAFKAVYRFDEEDGIEIQLDRFAVQR